ncbi:putative monooxygenase [Sclerotinia borealis F-4128]|uniref:Putative monooxygenase n=1 Tax=Sclerotinia borealis (strain F-4128) TaxID=1432307 RepID=W9CQ83_SCLBF|nr:putative monooxygenase [Sclerotinia borealis F-4128]
MSYTNGLPHGNEVNEEIKFFVNGDKEEFDPKNWTGSQNQLPIRGKETGINVLIVGAGLAGLTCALECWRKGHNIVGILERNKGPNYSGDLIFIQPSASNFMRYWPDMCRDLKEDKTDIPEYYRKHNGELIYGPSEPHFNDPEDISFREKIGAPHVGALQIRKKFYRMLLRQVAKLGIKVEYGERVEKYFEDEAAGLGGVMTESGSIRVAHIVVAADSAKSKSEILIAGEHMPSVSSGMSVYRASYPGYLAKKDPILQKRWGGENSVSHELWLGPGMHIGLFFSSEFVAFGITPRNNFLVEGSTEAKESWDPTVDPEEVIQVLKRVSDWDEAIVALVKNAPKGSVIHWPLLWRNLRREWTSKSGHVVQIGDAAHSNVPSSASGGTLALEDAITLASCLQLATHGGGSGAAGLGAKVYNLLRWQRVSCNQKMAFVNSQATNTKSMDWDAIGKDPKKVRLRFCKWFFRHDPEAYVYEKYGQAFAHLVDGADFQNTNIPPGHKFVPWTVEEVQKDIKEGKRIEEFLDGDWS